MGANRELKKLVEGYWAGKTDKAAFIQGTKDLRVAHWKVQVDSGISLIPSNDFSLYGNTIVLCRVLFFHRPGLGSLICFQCHS